MHKRKTWPTHWTMNLVSVAFAGPFITLNTVILGTPERLDISCRHAAPPLAASTENRSLVLPPAKSPSAPPTQHNKKLHNPIHSQANLDCNTQWQFLFDTGISAWCFAVIFSSYNCLQNKCIRWCSKIFFCLSKLHSGRVIYCISTLEAGGLQCIRKRRCSTYRGERVSVGFGTVLVIHVRLPERPKNLPHNPTIKQRRSKKQQRRPQQPLERRFMGPPWSESSRGDGGMRAL